MAMKNLNHFGGERSDQYNAIFNAILECGQDYMNENHEPKDIQDAGDNACYDWIDNTPKTSLTVELVDKLNEMGFKIVKI